MTEGKSAKRSPSELTALLSADGDSKRLSRNASFVGTSVENLKRAQKLYENPVGPGAYTLPDIIGKRGNNSKNTSPPFFTLGIPISTSVNPENRDL